MLRILRFENVIECRILSRLNRFVVEVECDGQKLRAHINNTGRLEGFLENNKRGFGLLPEQPGKADNRMFAAAWS